MMKMKLGPKGIAVLGICLALFGGGFWIASAATATAPSLPPVVLLPDLSNVPSLIPVVDASGKQVGFAKATDVFGPPPPPGAVSASTNLGDPVYDASGTTLVGYVGVDGFKPLP